MENTTGINAGGTRQNAAVKYCTTCGEALNPMAEICPKCGVRQAMPAAAPAPSVHPAPNVKYCTACGASLNQAAEICPKCGVRQAMPDAHAPAIQPAPNVKYCTTCGASLNLAAEICPKCGVRQTAATPNMLFGSGSGSSRSMGFFESWATCLQKTFNYKDRASQSEFAYFTLSQAGIGFVLSFFSSPVLNTLSTIFEIVLILPSISASVRRFHDFDTSGWFFLLTFIIVNLISIPIGLFFGFAAGFASLIGEQGTVTTIGYTILYGLVFIVNLVIALIKGTEGANRYGA